MNDARANVKTLRQHYADLLADGLTPMDILAQLDLRVSAVELAVRDLTAFVPALQRAFGGTIAPQGSIYDVLGMVPNPPPEQITIRTVDSMDMSLAITPLRNPELVEGRKTDDENNQGSDCRV